MLPYRPTNIDCSMQYEKLKESIRNLKRRHQEKLGQRSVKLCIDKNGENFGDSS